MNSENLFRNNQFEQTSTGEYLEALSERHYNLVIGGLVFYGLMAAALISHFLGTNALSMNTGTVMVLYFIGAIAGSFMIRSRKVSLAFIGYNLIVLPLGLMLSIITQYYDLTEPGMVDKAIFLTAGISAIMLILSATYPSFFMGIGRTLCTTLLVTIIAEIACSLFGYDLAMADYLVVLIFMGFIGYDWARASMMEHTLGNAILAACEIYLDLVNIFIRILSIMGRNRRSN